MAKSTVKAGEILLTGTLTEIEFIEAWAAALTNDFCEIVGEDVFHNEYTIVLGFARSTVAEMKEEVSDAKKAAKFALEEKANQGRDYFVLTHVEGGEIVSDFSDFDKEAVKYEKETLKGYAKGLKIHKVAYSAKCTQDLLKQLNAPAAEPAKAEPKQTEIINYTEIKEGDVLHVHGLILKVKKCVFNIFGQGLDDVVGWDCIVIVDTSPEHYFLPNWVFKRNETQDGYDRTKYYAQGNHLATIRREII